MQTAFVSTRPARAQHLHMSVYRLEKDSCIIFLAADLLAMKSKTSAALSTEHKGLKLLTASKFLRLPTGFSWSRAAEMEPLK